RRDRLVVGVNAFEQEEPSPADGAGPRAMRVDPRGEAEQVETLRAMRARRDRSTHAAALDRLDQAARGTENLVPRVLDAVKAYATVGEISDVLRRIWGEHVETLFV
ncbi:MAG: methylmalonyl-CoA mutase family protein, partial [Polyangiaceae bacterium]